MKLKLTARAKQLVITIILAEDYKNVKVNGLLGNINGNSSDDLTTPSGDTLPPDSSDEDIFWKFGVKCKLDMVNFYYDCVKPFTYHT